MIRKVTIENFQSHAKTEMDLGAFTAVTGPSSSGKSAAIRALNWLFYGEWNDLFVADTESPTVVSVTLDDGTEITRIRKGKTNKAVIARPGQETLRLKDFGEIIPGVFDIINMREVPMGDRSINLNFSNQDDPAFLVNSKAWSRPARAQWLGRLYGAHIVNTMLRLMDKDGKEADKEAKRIEQDTESLETKRKAYAELPDMEEAISAAGSSLASLKAAEELASDADSYADKVAVLESKRSVIMADTAAMKAAADTLVKLNVTSFAAFGVSMLEDKVASLSRLASTDPAGAKACTASLERLVALRVSAAKISDMQVAAESKRRLVGFDGKSTRSGVDAASAMTRLCSDFGRFKAAVASLKSKASVKDFDISNANGSVAIVDAMLSVAAESRRVEHDATKAATRLRDLGTEISVARTEMFKNGMCPVCGAAKAVAA